MKQLTFILFIVLALASCRSVKQTSTKTYQQVQKDSSSYVSVTKVDIDTTIIPSDTATMEAVLTKDEFGKLYLESIKQDKGNDISLTYTIEKTPEGKTKVSVKAISDKKEVLTQNVTTDVVKENISVDDLVVTQTETKKVKGFSMWNLAWVIPLALIIIVIYLKRKTILKYFGW